MYTTAVYSCVNGESAKVDGSKTARIMNGLYYLGSTLLMSVLLKQYYHSSVFSIDFLHVAIKVL